MKCALTKAKNDAALNQLKIDAAKSKKAKEEAENKKPEKPEPAKPASAQTPAPEPEKKKEPEPDNSATIARINALEAKIDQIISNKASEKKEQP